MQSDKLRAFLSLSKSNYAVLTDYAAMEAFQGATLTSIQASWSVLRSFPDQMLVLKETRASGLIAAEPPGNANRMISRPQTEGARGFGILLDRAASGDVRIQQQLLERGKQANDHMRKMSLCCADLDRNISEFSNAFSERELKRFRKEEPWTESMGEKFFSLIENLSKISFSRHPDKPKIHKSKYLINHFIYRHTITYLIYVMRLVGRGAQNRKEEKARNDAVDVIFATYATYFNGFMSMDKEASAIHAIARGIMKRADARIPENYLDSYYQEIVD